MGGPSILGSEFVRRPFPQRRVRTTIVLLAPSFNNLAGLAQHHEPMGIQAFLRERAIEQLSVGITVGFPGREKSIRTPF